METEQTAFTTANPETELTPTPQEPKKTQGWLNVLKFIIPYLIFVAVFQLLGMLIAGVDIMHMKEMNQTPLQMTIVSVFSLAGTLLVIWLFMRYIDKKPFVSLGFSKQFMLRDILLGILVGIVLMLTGFGLLLAMGELSIESIQFSFSNFLLNLLLFSCVAVTEEVMTRGYILSNLMASMNKFIALAISSLIFSLLHLANPNVTFLSLSNIFMAGVILGIPYIINRRLWFPIALHLSWNFMQGPVLGYKVSGITTSTIITTQYPTESIWNGGTFGFEGSLPSLILLIVASVGMYFYYRKKEAQ